MRRGKAMSAETFTASEVESSLLWCPYDFKNGEQWIDMSAENLQNLACCCPAMAPPCNRAKNRLGYDVGRLRGK